MFVWYVYEGYDDAGLHLSIVSDDRKFIVEYMFKECISQKSSLTKMIRVSGKEFKGRTDCGGCTKRFLVPDWDDNIITPSLVEKIIEWCFLEESIIEVDYKGNPVC